VVAGLVTAVLAGSASSALAGGGRTVNIFPNPSAPGTSTTFQVNCGSQSAAGPATSATLEGSSLGLAAQVPMQSGGQTNEFVTTVVLPTSLSPGTYSPDIVCSNGVTASAALTVNAVPTPAPVTGDGTTATATNSMLTNVGFALLGLGAIVGGVLLRRRRSGT
jgi:MYXO-CTERM domain-containing protein